MNKEIKLTDDVQELYNKVVSVELQETFSLARKFEKAKIREYMREYHKRPDVKAKMREYHKRPDVKAKMREYSNRPDVKTKKSEYDKLRLRNKKVSDETGEEE